MNAVWSQVPRQLEIISGQRYASFGLVTEKNRVHSWSPTLQVGKIVPYAPRDFSKLSDPLQYTELAQADEKYLITDNEGAQSGNIGDWTVMRLIP